MSKIAIAILYAATILTLWRPIVEVYTETISPAIDTLCITLEETSNGTD